MENIMNQQQIDNFVRNNAKNEEQARALRDNLTFKNDKTVRAAFGDLGSYLAHVEKPEQSAFKVSNVNGVTKIEKNFNRKLSPISEQEIKQNWNNTASLRCEFPSFEVYRKWYESAVLGRSKIKGQSSMA
jgi:hypothetical protein